MFQLARNWLGINSTFDIQIDKPMIVQLRDLAANLEPTTTIPTKSTLYEVYPAAISKVQKLVPLFLGIDMLSNTRGYYLCLIQIYRSSL